MGEMKATDSVGRRAQSGLGLVFFYHFNLFDLFTEASLAPAQWTITSGDYY
jgi:hypothetical protein